MTSIDFVATLRSHNLTVSSFLDLKEAWERLDSRIRYRLVREEYLLAKRDELSKQKEIEEAKYNDGSE